MAKMATRKRAVTLAAIAKLAGISFKTVQAAFAQPGAPARTRSVEELVEWLRSAAPGTVQLPSDLADRMIMLKYETSKERAKREKEAAEKLRLQNLEKKGQLVERAEVQAEGAAIGLILSSTLSGWVKDLPAELVGKSELDITRTLSSKVDALISQIRGKLSR